MKIETKRLILRPLKNSDAKSIVENVNNLSISKWLLVVPYPYTIKDAKKWIIDNKEKWSTKKKSEYSFGIGVKKDGKIIGGIGLHKINNEQGTATIGIWLGKNYQREGLGSEAFTALLNLAFNKLKLRRVEAGIFVGNPASPKLMTKFGGKLEGTKRKSCRSKADNKIHDEMIYGLLKEDWLKAKKRS